MKNQLHGLIVLYVKIVEYVEQIDNTNLKKGLKGPTSDIERFILYSFSKVEDWTQPGHP